MASLIINGSAQNQTLSGTLSYDSVSITNGGTLFVTPYDGTGSTGILILNVTGDVTVDATSNINGDARGYLGGNGGDTTPSGCYGRGGTGSGGGTNGYCQSGGGGGGGGGGSYGSSGGSGGVSGYGRAGGSGGSIYGTQSGSDIAMGSGSGGGGGVYGIGNGGNGNPGGAMLTINANNIYIHGTISFNGGSGGIAYSNASYYGGGGGGGASGGGIYLNSTNNMDLSSSTIRANGGSGGPGGASGGQPGSTGGGGRIKIFYGGAYTAPTTLSAGTTYVLQTTGNASFTSNPTGARIWIDGIDKGVNTPNTITGLSPVTHNYTLKLAGYADSTGSFSVTTGSTTTVPTVTFAPSAIFTTTPSGASIYIDNVLQGVTAPATITGLTAGSHTYKLFLAGYNAVTGNFNTIAGQTTTVPTVLLTGTAMAFLSAGD